jgi:hypothetical protein
LSSKMFFQRREVKKSSQEISNARYKINSQHLRKITQQKPKKCMFSKLKH